MLPALNSAAGEIVRKQTFTPVDGVEIPSRLSIPFRFGGGSAKPKPGEDPRPGAAPPQEADLPALSALSSIPGVELPQIRYQAPARP